MYQIQKSMHFILCIDFYFFGHKTLYRTSKIDYAIRVPLSKVSSTLKGGNKWKV